MSHDVTEQRRTEQHLRERALVDALTGLANRRALDEELAATHAGTCCFAVFFVDLDGLKGINDRHGHDAGDALLREAAQRWARLCAGDFVSRLGGDEFVVVSRGVADARDAGRIAQAICGALARPFVTGGMRVEASASVGVAIHDASVAAADLLAIADTAMYEAKRAGRNTGGSAARRWRKRAAKPDARRWCRFRSFRFRRFESRRATLFAHVPLSPVFHTPSRCARPGTKPAHLPTDDLLTRLRASTHDRAGSAIIGARQTRKARRAGMMQPQCRPMPPAIIARMSSCLAVVVLVLLVSLIRTRP
jgi:diguanylate cyclase (GGDEF)-like protein